MNGRRRLLPIFISLLVGMFMWTSNAFRIEKNQVVIENDLKYNETLKVHCKSKDNDLKLHELSAGTSFFFAFHDNLFLTTLFWCNVWKGPDYKHHQVFVAYKSRGHLPIGVTYLWEVREDGIYLCKNLKPCVFKYAWDASHKDDLAPVGLVDDED